MRKRSFHVSYHWKTEKQTGLGCVNMQIVGKLNQESIMGMKNWIEKDSPDKPGMVCIILSIVELEK